MQYIAQTAETEVSEALIATIHRLTTLGIDYERNSPGMYRHHAAEAGGYIPPREHDEVRALMARFVDWINSGDRQGWDCIIRAIVSHFYLVSIHPFGDGNGRTARGVESFVLYKGGVNVRGFYSLANFYYLQRPEYIRLLDHTRFDSNGDLTPFVLFALRGLKGELDQVRREIVTESRWIAFRDYALSQIFGSEGPEKTNVRWRMFQLVGAIPRGGIAQTQLKLHAPVFVPEYKKVGDRTLLRDIKKLRELELVAIEGDHYFANIGIMDRFIPTT
jgi:Fic family protein